MKTRILAALLAFLVAPGAVAAAASPPAPILKLTNAVLRATNTDDVTAFSGLYTADAVVVDENPPYVWRGATAGADWWRVVEAVVKTMKLTHLRAVNVRVSEFKTTATDAYMVQPMTIAGVADGKPFAEAGTLTYTFHNAGGKWLISTQVWSTKP